MRNKRPLVLLLLACCLAQPVFGARVIGMPDCGGWVRDSKERSSDRAWLLGYLSGLSSMHEFFGKNDNPLAKISSSNQIYVWMDNYCQKSPLKNVADGAETLFLELQQK
jgi:hypothetical protein